ncbi:HPr kinase/phosphorylase [Hyphomicrobium denitrificans]|uniref:HPr kinase/phosphorylase n=1 Tax=Hyphomicrobium denitrificans TaxID=53399 RepID=UPI00022E8948|nr:HPr kinase/phosphatase C-terminal domain-containing protein [Hyphomicrobium denitrificans]
MPGEADRIHATAIAVGGRGVLIRGPSGAGKSDLALRCLAFGPSTLLRDTVKLVADDQVILRNDRSRTLHRLIASAPATLRGKIEVRGVGILEVAVEDEAEIALVADLARESPVERYPDPWPMIVISGVEIPLIRLLPFENSAPLKIFAALDMVSLPRIEGKD